MNNISKRYLAEAYDEAQEYVKKFVKRSEYMLNTYVEKDRFYKEATGKDNILMVLSIILGIGGFVEWSVVKEAFLNNFGSSDLYFSPEFTEYLLVLYILACVGLLLFGIWNVFLRYYAINAKRELLNMQNWCESVKQNVATLHENYAKLEQDLFTKPAEIQLVDAANGEVHYRNYLKRMDNIECETKKKRLVLFIVLFPVLFIAHFSCLGSFSLKAIQNATPVEGLWTISWSYLLLIWLVYKFQSNMFEYLQKFTKLVTVGIFLVYQGAMAFVMMKLNLFVPVFSGLSKGALILLVTSIVIIMNIISTNIEKERKMLKKGDNTQNTDGTSLIISEKNIKSGNVFTAILATAYLIFGTFFMVLILEGSFRFSSIVIYLVLVIVWIVISVLFSNPQNDAVYGSRLKWVRNAFYCCFAFSTLSEVQGFGIGSIILLLIPWIVSILGERPTNSIT